MPDVNLDGISFRAFDFPEGGTVLGPPGNIPGAATIDLSAIKFRANEITTQWMQEEATTEVEWVE